MNIAISGNDIVDVMNFEYNVEHSEWWVRTTENLKVPNKFPWVVIMAVGKGATLEEACKDAAAKHLEVRRKRKEQEGIT